MLHVPDTNNDHANNDKNTGKYRNCAKIYEVKKPYKNIGNIGTVDRLRKFELLVSQGSVATCLM